MSKKKKKFKESIGIDIGSHSIKIVHLVRRKNRLELANYAVKKTVPEDIEYNPSDLSNSRYAPLISRMFKEMNIKPNKKKHIVSAIGGDNVSIKQIKTIFLPEDELESALFFEAKKHLPISGSDMILDYQVINVEEKTNNMNILLAASKKEQLDRHTSILNSAGVIPGTVDIEPLAIVNSLTLNYPVEEGAYVMLDLGAHTTNMVIYSPESKLFSRNIDFGGYMLTKDIMKQKGIAFSEAEEFKLKYGLKEKSDKKKDDIVALDIAEKTAVEQIALAVRRSMRFYVKEAGNSDFRKIYLTGGTANTLGLPKFLEKQLNIPVEKFNPFESVRVPRDLKYNPDPQLTLAMGLALRPE